MKTLLKCLLPAVLLVTAQTASATAVDIGSATLSGAQEVPSIPTSATGTLDLSLNGDLLTATLSFTGLTTVPAAIFIHCCTPPGSNTIVAISLVGFPSATSGSYSSTLDLSLSSSYISNFVTDNGGTAASAEAALLAGIAAGDAYINIHDADFPGGEIRGDIAAPTSTTLTPEPSSLSLVAMALGLGGILYLRLR